MNSSVKISIYGGMIVSLFYVIPCFQIQTDCFYDTVHKLSFNDVLLNSRLDKKKKLITMATPKQQWLATMNRIKSSGTTFSCGYTR